MSLRGPLSVRARSSTRWDCKTGRVSTHRERNGGGCPDQSSARTTPRLTTRKGVSRRGSSSSTGGATFFKAAANPEARHVPYLCVKFLAEPVRILAWLRGGDQNRDTRRGAATGTQGDA